MMDVYSCTVYRECLQYITAEICNVVSIACIEDESCAEEHSTARRKE